MLNIIEIITLLNIYYCGVIQEFNSSLQKTQTLETLHRHQLIELDPGGTEDEPLYTMTDKGSCFVEAIRDLPMPVQVFVMPTAPRKEKA